MTATSRRRSDVRPETIAAGEASDGIESIESLVDLFNHLQDLITTCEQARRTFEDGAAEYDGQSVAVEWHRSRAAVWAGAAGIMRGAAEALDAIMEATRAARWGH